MKTVVGITWLPRKVETFQQMQHSIKFDNCIVYPDGVKFTHRTDFEVMELGENKGCFKHYYRVLKDLYENADAELIAIFPDDVIFKEGWLSLVHQQFRKNPYIGYLACYTPKGMRHLVTGRTGWHEIKGGWAKSWGGGYVYRRNVVGKLLKHPFILNHLDNYEKNQQIDHAIPEAIHQMGLIQMIHNPSLLQHVGKFSTIGHKHRPIDNALGW